MVIRMVGIVKRGGQIRKTFGTSDLAVAHLRCWPQRVHEPPIEDADRHARRTRAMRVRAVRRFLQRLQRTQELRRGGVVASSERPRV